MIPLRSRGERMKRQTPRRPWSRGVLIAFEIWQPILLQLQRRRVDAVAQAGRPRSVREDMAEMAGAFRAQYLCADHAVGGVVFLVDMTLDGRRGEARPAAAGIELGVGLEQRLAAAGAHIGAGLSLIFVLAGERPLGRLLTQYSILHRRQLLAPLGFAFGDFVRYLGVSHYSSIPT